MKKLLSHMHVSLDGFAGGPNGEMDWILHDHEMFDFVKTLTDLADTALYGRVTWQMMEDYWPTAGDKPNASQHDKDHSSWYLAVDKMVISNSMKGEKKAKTTFVDDPVTHVHALKQGEGKDILLLGSPSVTRALMKENLIDEYWLYVNPVILGKGISMFTSLDDRLWLEPKPPRTFSSGVTALCFTAKR